MKILKRHSHKGGLEYVENHHAALLTEITRTINQVNAVQYATKIPKEKSRIKRCGLLFSPRAINAAFRHILYPAGWAHWNKQKKKYEEPAVYFTDDTAGADRYRKMDGLKDRVGLEIQFGKYAFMGYDVFSKMIIFRNLDYIDCGIEIVAVQEMVNCMSTGVSAFEHLMIDFEHRGEADIDIPVLVLGIGPDENEWEQVHIMQDLFQTDPEQARKQYPQIGQHDLKGTIPGPKN